MTTGFSEFVAGSLSDIRDRPDVILRERPTVMLEGYGVFTELELGLRCASILSVLEKLIYEMRSVRI
jgi:hypothetical protein